MTLDLAKLRAETLALLDGTTPGTACTHCYGRSANDRCLNCGAYLPAPTLAADNLRLMDEIERLRAALRHIAGYEPNEKHSGNRNDLIAHAAVAAASAALAEGGPDAR